MTTYGIHKKLIKDAIKVLDTDRDGKLKADDFVRLKEMPTNLIERALKGEVAIPDWQAFVKDVRILLYFILLSLSLLQYCLYYYRQTDLSLTSSFFFPPSVKKFLRNFAAMSLEPRQLTSLR